MIRIIELDSRAVREHGNLYHSHRNQLRRAVGPYTVVYCGGTDGGTVMDRAGKCWDWWFTDEVIVGNFRKIRVVEAR